MEPKIIVALLAIAAGLFAIVANNRLSDWRNRNTVIRNNAHTLKCAFAIVISDLESPVRTQDVRDILIREFTDHNIAVTIFRGNINWFSKYRLKKAWQQYHSGHCFDADDWEIPKEDQLFMDCFSIEDQSEAAKIYLKRIHKILRIANQK